MTDSSFDVEAQAKLVPSMIMANTLTKELNKDQLIKCFKIMKLNVTDAIKAIQQINDFYKKSTVRFDIIRNIEIDFPTEENIPIFVELLCILGKCFEIQYINTLSDKFSNKIFDLTSKLNSSLERSIKASEKANTAEKTVENLRLILKAEIEKSTKLQSENESLKANDSNNSKAKAKAIEVLSDTSKIKEIESLKEKIAKLQSENDSLKAKINNNESVNNEISKLENENQSLKEKLTTTANENESLKSEIAKMKEDAKSAALNLLEYQPVKKENENLKKEIEDLKAQVSSLEQSVNNEKNLNSTFITDNKNLRNEMVNLEERRKKAENTSKKLQLLLKRKNIPFDLNKL